MSQELQGDAKAERVVLNGVDSLMCRLTSETANLSVTATTKDDDAAGRNHEQTQGGPAEVTPVDVPKKRKKKKNRKQQGLYDMARMAGLSDAQWGPPVQTFSQQNLYIRSLSPETTDASLYDMCIQFGTISSAKAIVDKPSKDGEQCCRGYGFVLFENPRAAALAVRVLTAQGIEASFARESQRAPTFPPPREDPTNLYFSNLPIEFNETELEGLLAPFGQVVSSRILRNVAGISRGVGFARMASRIVCDKVIQTLDGSVVAGATELLICKFADNPTHFRAAATQFTPAMQHPHMANVVPRDGRGMPMFVAAAPAHHAAMPSGAMAVGHQPHLNQLHESNQFVRMVPVHGSAGQPYPTYSTVDGVMSPLSPIATDNHQATMLGFIPQQQAGYQQPANYSPTHFPTPPAYYSSMSGVSNSPSMHNVDPRAQLAFYQPLGGQLLAGQMQPPTALPTAGQLHTHQSPSQFVQQAPHQTPPAEN